MTITTVKAGEGEALNERIVQAFKEMNPAERHFFTRMIEAMVEKRPRRAVQAAKDFAQLRGQDVPPELLAAIRAAVRGAA